MTICQIKIKNYKCLQILSQKQQMFAKMSVLRLKARKKLHIIIRLKTANVCNFAFKNNKCLQKDLINYKSLHMIYCKYGSIYHERKLIT
nr:MAG TPA: hypothetical protein [Caudoviricetes sp.]